MTLTRLPRLFLVLSALVALAAPLDAQTAAPGPLVTQIFGGGRTALVVVLHGDLSDGGPATYHAEFARRVASANPGTTVAALIRPGYQAGNGAVSTGSHNGRRDHYTRRNNTLVAQTIANLKAATGAARVIVVGHSGGAAQLGGVIGTTKGLVDSAILVSCPCDIQRWRQMRGRSNWSSSQSPVRLLRRADRGVRVIAVTGANDDNTAPGLARDYVARAQAAGMAAAFIEVPGAGHGFGRALSQMTLNAVTSEIRR